MKKRAPRGEKGIALVPVILVLLVVASLLAVGLATFGPLARRGKVNATKDTLDATVKALISWAEPNKRLPCAANDNAGYCTSQGDELAEAVQNPNDAWSKPLFYIYDNHLADPAQGGLCGRATTNLTVRLCPDAGCAAPAAVLPNVAFIVLSGGENYNNQTFGTGGVTAATTVNVYDSSVTLDAYTTDMNRGESYDDVVRWVTLGELKSRAGCSGTTRGALKILNNQLPDACIGQAYSAAVYAEGGVPSSGSPYYTWSNSVTPTPAWTVAASGAYDYYTISGTPACATPPCFHTFFVNANDTNGNTAQRALALRVKNCVGEDISFSDPGDMTGFSLNVVENNSPAVSVDTSTNTVTFGGGLLNTSGCVWYPTTVTLANRTLRAFFNFSFANIDSSGNSTAYADGFTFALMQGSSPTTYCGTGTTYNATTNPNFQCTGGFGEFLGYCGLPGESVAVEFDTYPNNGRNDPAGSYNHVAVVKSTSTHTGGLPAGTYGDNTHNVGGNPACNGTDPGCVYDNAFGNGYPVTWLEDGATHSARIEVHTGCTNTCATCEIAGNTYAFFKVWVDCAGCNDITGNFTGSAPKVTHCFNLSGAMNQVKMGFTEATGASVDVATLSNFNAGLFSWPSCTLTASPTVVNSGAANLTWAVAGGAANGTWSAPLPGGSCSNFTNSSGGGGTCTTANLSTPGANTFTLTVSNAGGSSPCSAVVTYCPALSIVTSSLPNGVRSTAYTTTTVTGSGGITPYTWGASNLPPGLSINASSGAVSGTPTTAGTYNATVTLTDSCPSAQNASRPYTIVIYRYGTYNVRNNRGSAFWVRGGAYGACTRIANNTDFSVNFTDATPVSLYTNNACTLAASLPSVSFQQASSVDEAGDRDSNVRVSNTWQLLDR
ncbi:MAG: putative Ig domain-containing protein [Thermodesulfovibrionales bacterium]